MFEGKRIILGISGGIAAYKSAYLASALSKTDAEIEVIMTKNASKFISPLTFEVLTKSKCHIDTFELTDDYGVSHVELAKSADLFVVAPATANVIAKLANGVADDMLTTTFLAAKCHKIIVPAMNTAMFENEATQHNLNVLSQRDVEITSPSLGLLACGDVGIGKMPEPERIFAYVEKAVSREKDLIGKKVLVTAGATQESIDPVRILTNRSTGKMGCAIAKEAMMRGADVTLVRASMSVPEPDFVECIKAMSAAEMFEEVIKLAPESDIIIKTAAVSDYTPKEFTKEKIKKSDEDVTIDLKRTDDILKSIGELKSKEQFVCGFSMETSNLIENSKAKLKKKNLNMIVANSLSDEGAGFATDTNDVTIMTPSTKEFDKGRGEVDIARIPLTSKANVAKKIMDKIVERL